MTSSEGLCVILVTAPDLEVARILARGALQHRFVACANIIQGVESHYWWEGKIDSGNEVLCIFKTTRERGAAFEQFILKNHPYKTPEIVVLPITAGTERYLAWLRAETNE